MSLTWHSLKCCLSATPSIRLSFCPYVQSSVRLSACLPVCMSACLPTCLSACLSVCLSPCLPVCLPASLPACLPASLPASLPVCLSAYLPTCLPACLSVFCNAPFRTFSVRYNMNFLSYVYMCDFGLRFGCLCIHVDSTKRTKMRRAFSNSIKIKFLKSCYD